MGVICCPVLKDSEPCETSPLDMILGCQKCLFMFEVGGMVQGGLSVLSLGGSHVGGRLLWLSLRHSQGKALQKELASRLQRDLHFCF